MGTREVATPEGCLSADLADCAATLEGIELFGITVDAERRFSYGVQPRRMHAFLRFTAGPHTAWVEANLGEVRQGVGFAGATQSLEWLGLLKGCSIGAAFAYLRRHRSQHGYRELEYAELALLDLAGRALDRPALDLLGLHGRESIPGLHCILTDDASRVRAEAGRACERGLRSHAKVKLFGDTATDLGVIRAAREVYGDETYLVGDANEGYEPGPGRKAAEGLAAFLITLHDAGLSACEDPAEMTVPEWIALQEAVGALDLVPDVPMRPAWVGRRALHRDMGRVFNLHPACMGSVLETIHLARAIQGFGRRLMVGDSSLVGPACSIWQQLAVGLGADWVEAIEKPGESNTYQACLVHSPTEQVDGGRFALRALRPGFGIELDQERLFALSDEYLVL